MYRGLNIILIFAKEIALDVQNGIVVSGACVFRYFFTLF